MHVPALHRPAAPRREPRGHHRRGRGEIAHGFFYPNGYAELDGLSVEDKVARFAATVVSRHAPVPGASETAKRHVQAHVVAVLKGIAALGVTETTMLDYYYLRERLRRWGSTGERLGTVSPLLSPSFIVAALNLSTQERKSNWLHRGVIGELVPRWADVPFFPGPVSEQGSTAASVAWRPVPPPPKVQRLGSATDADEITGLLMDDSAWGRSFDKDHVHALWHRSVAGETVAREERILRSVVWRGAFEDQVADLNHVARVPHAAVAIPVPPPQVEPPAPAGISRPGQRRSRAGDVCRLALGSLPEGRRCGNAPTPDGQGHGQDAGLGGDPPHPGRPQGQSPREAARHR